MKLLNKITIILAMVIALIAFGIWLYRSGPPCPECPPEGMVLVKQSQIDSLQQLMDTYKDSVLIDTVYLPSDTIYEDSSKPETQPSDDPKVNISKDKFVTPMYTVWVTNYLVNNAVVDSKWKGTSPRAMILEKTVIKPVLQPYSIKQVAHTYPLHSISISGGVGVGSTGIPVMVRINYINAKRITYGLQYQRLLDQGFVLADLGFVIASW